MWISRAIWPRALPSNSPRAAVIRMAVHSGRIEVATRGKGLYPFTRDVERWLREICTALTHTSLSIPVIQGRMALGTWQGIYLFEHRTSAMGRSVILQLVF